MNLNFELILFYATLITGLICLYDWLILRIKRKRAKTEKKPSVIVEYAWSFFPVLLIVFLLRSFLYEPFRIPSGSLEPTLQIGDFILVNKFDYGFRLPVIHKKLIGDGKPQRGDIIVFRWPPNPSVDFIKRVIGVPGDKISYINKVLYINGQKVSQTNIGPAVAEDESGGNWQALEKEEALFDVKHRILIDQNKPSGDLFDVTVPDGMYFVMGDNRDDSADSRYWGFVPDENIVGKAVMIWLSWDGQNTNLRWNRIGKMIR